MVNSTDMVESINETVISLTTNTDLTFRNFLRIAGTITSSINLVITFIAASTLLKARLIPFSIRVFVFCLFVCDGFILVSCILWTSSEHFGQLSYQMDRGFIFLEWVLIASLSIDRVMALDNPRIYLKYLGNKFISGYVFTLILLGIFLRLLTIVLPDFDMVSVCVVIITALCILIIITIVCSLRIFIICKRHVRQIRTLQIGGANQKQRSKARAIGSSGTILIIMTTFVGLQTPFVIEMISVKCVTPLYSRLFTYPCVLLSCFMNTLLYCWRFKECRRILLGWMCTVVKRLIILQESTFFNIMGIKINRNSSTGINANVTNFTTYM